jgi:hypothetical protein
MRCSRREGVYYLNSTVLTTGGNPHYYDVSSADELDTTW